MRAAGLDDIPSNLGSRGPVRLCDGLGCITKAFWPRTLSGTPSGRLRRVSTLGRALRAVLGASVGRELSWESAAGVRSYQRLPPCSRACTVGPCAWQATSGLCPGALLPHAPRGEYLLGNLKFTELYLHLGLPDARAVTWPQGAPRREPLSAHERPTSRSMDGAAVAGALTLRRGNEMALRNRYATTALLALLALTLVALAGCGETTNITTPAGTAANTVTASGAGTTQAVTDSGRVCTAEVAVRTRCGPPLICR